MGTSRIEPVRRFEWARTGARRLKSAVFAIPDLVAACAMFLLIAAWVTIRMLVVRRRPRPSAARKLLVLDMSYTLEEVRARQLHQPITARDLDGFFAHVWSVHPCATIVPPADPEDTFGTFVVTPFAPSHTVVEGKIGRFRALRHLPVLNFLVAQYELLRHLDRLLRTESISAIRAGEPYFLGSLALALSGITGVPCVFRIPVNYDIFFEEIGQLAFPRLFRWRWLERAISHVTLARADLVAGSNQDSLNFALANGARPEYSTLFRVGNLIHPAHLQPPEERPDAGPILGELGLVGRMFSMTTSRLEGMKHIDDLLRAVAEIRKAGIDLHALVVGDGRLRDELVALAESLGIRDQVVFAGNQPQEWIAAVLPCATLVISPHMGRGLTEALMGGAPAVAYDVDWQGEVVIHGKTGELVPYRDWKAMAQAAVRVCADPAYAKRLGASARVSIFEMMDPVKLSAHERHEYLKLFARVSGQAMPGEIDARA